MKDDILKYLPYVFLFVAVGCLVAGKDGQGTLCIWGAIIIATIERIMTWAQKMMESAT